MNFFAGAVVFASLTTSDAFSRFSPSTARVSHLFSSLEPDDGNLLNGLKAGFNIFRKGITAGDGFKQSVADALAGPELDLSVENARIDAYIKSAPVVVFSWTVSGFSTKAKKCLKSIGVDYEAIELDQPWSDGNPIRSALGRRVGRTSVPAIFIDGVYIGGCDDGPSEEAPGLIPLALQGKLRPMLISAGALTSDPAVDGNVVVKPSVSSKASEEYVVSKVVLKNQKMSSPSDVFVSTTVAANMLKALSAPVVSQQVEVQTPVAVAAAAVVVEHIEVEVKADVVPEVTIDAAVVSASLDEPVAHSPIIEEPAPVKVVEHAEVGIKAEVKEEIVVEEQTPVVVAEPVKAEVKVEAVVEKPEPVVEHVEVEVKAEAVVEEQTPVVVAEPVKAEIKVEVVVEKPEPVVEHVEVEVKAEAVVEEQTPVVVAEPVKAEVKVEVVVEKPEPVVEHVEVEVKAEAVVEEQTPVVVAEPVKMEVKEEAVVEEAVAVVVVEEAAAGEPSAPVAIKAKKRKGKTDESK